MIARLLASLLSLSLVSTSAAPAWAQLRVATPQAPVSPAPALGRLGSLLQNAAAGAGLALPLAAPGGSLLLPAPSIQPGMGPVVEQRAGVAEAARPVAAGLPSLVAAAPASALAALPSGAAAEKLAVLMGRLQAAPAASGGAGVTAAEASRRPAVQARAMLSGISAELEKVSAEELRSMPLERLNAWSERVLEGLLGRASAASDVAPPRTSAPSRWSRGLIELARSAREAAVPKADPAAQVPPPAQPAPRTDSDSINWKTALGLFSQRSLSIAAFIATTIAYPFAAVPVVGWTGFGILMAFGPMAGIAAGPIAGRIIDRMSTKTAMAVNAALIGALQLVLPAFSFFGVLNFGTLLIASLAQGWLLSTVMTTEGAFLKRLFPVKHLGAVNGLLQLNYFAVQVVLGLLVGLGQIVDKWNPFAVFAGAAAVNLLAVVPLILMFIPNIAPVKTAAAGQAAKPEGSFLKRNWQGLLAVAAAVAAYPLLHTPLPVAAALLFWISRSANFGLVWRGEGAEPLEGVDPAAAKGRLRYAMLFMALGAMMLYPLQSFVLPRVAEALVGAQGKGLLLGQLLGALFFGNMISTAAQAKLPRVRIPFTGKTIGLERLIQGLVIGLGAAWAFLRLAPGNWLVAAGAAAAAAGLIALAQRVTARGWVKLVGGGFAAIWLPYLAWTGALPFLSVPVAMMLALVAIGMSYGPSFVSLITYFQRGAKASEMGKMGGIQGSFFNAAISIGYGALTLIASLINPPFPALLAVLGIAFALGGFLYWNAPKRLPGLPPTILTPGNKVGPSTHRQI